MSLKIFPKPSLDTLAELAKNLKEEPLLEKKLELLSQFEEVKNFFSNTPSFQSMFSTFSVREKIVLHSVIAVGQGERIFTPFPSLPKKEGQLLLTRLLPVEEFYQEIGGIVGYHVMCLQLLGQKTDREKRGTYHPPQAVDISEDNSFVFSQSIGAISHLDSLAEIYPIGGAADRLSLKNEKGEFQTAATMEFCTRTLIERLIDDLQAREFLYYKLYGKQIYVPVVMMTSDEKSNDAQVRKIFKEKKWFGRSEDNFFLFSQPLVPAMNTEGEWCLTGPMQLLCKPGGHGIIWKLMKELKILKWLQVRGKKKALMRQINNMIAGVDYGLLAFIGIGFQQDKAFGFASCPHIRGAQEGINVVIENEQGYCLTNIEYCDFERFGIDEKGEMEFLTNTNLLFVDINSIEKWVETKPIPGMLVNAKEMKYKDCEGRMHEEKILRLESTMQNLADALIDSQVMESSYITSNQRKKTISTIKKEFAFGASMLQTPEQCYLDLLENARDLLTNYCHFQVPDLRDAINFFIYGPSFIFLYHPALGPFYQIIRQKLRGGRLAMGSELNLMIADILFENLDVDGSLHVHTEAIMGHYDPNGILEYSGQTGKCILKNVRVRNSGINREASGAFWKNEIIRKEKCEILIEEGGEFYAEDLLLRGDIHIRVPSGVKVTAFMQNGCLELKHEVLPKPSWEWKYVVGTERIELTFLSKQKKSER